MWKIKDPTLKEKIMQLLSDESIAKRCKSQMTDGSNYILAADDDQKFSVSIDKDLFENVPEYKPDDWNPFPKVAPKSDIVYLVTLKTPSGQTVVTSSLYLAGFGWRKNFNLEVIAFREYPKPYKERK